MNIGKPTHLVTGEMRFGEHWRKGVTACGIVSDSISGKDLSKVDCLRCLKSKLFNRIKPQARVKYVRGQGYRIQNPDGSSQVWKH